MKKWILLVITALTLSAMEVGAQSAQERQEIKKQTKKELSEKASKEARNAAKQYKKEGWMVTPGSLPLEKQIDKSFMMQYEYDEDGFPKYIMSEAKSVAAAYDAGKMQAMELAKQALAGQIQTEVTALIENTVANDQLNIEQATSVVKSVQASKNLIQQSIGRVIPVVECYRESSGNKNTEVLVRVAYSMDMAKKAALRAARQDLEARGDSLHSQLNDLLGW